MIFLYPEMKEGKRKALFLVYRTKGVNVMNVWLFAGCMFLVAVFLNTLLLFGQIMVKKRRNKKWKREIEITD
ncbi:hypothetical protein COO05_16930 [Bacillus toyonensis]|nr:hypothetical protein COO05_16930 [Bacillus toyonensis]PED20401.1 hypothetical protein CON63_10290 [Bacillus toyonensis]PEM85636.1 hypothetical protein CN629_26275 [Bacillus toyonensis]PFY81478.1 hypothetical protein COL59_24985 [Bacillus toyonensis]PHG40589.1 hypothetical protein COI57_29730 [Bacillus toyonensis]